MLDEILEKVFGFIRNVIVIAIVTLPIWLILGLIINDMSFLGLLSYLLHNPREFIFLVIILFGAMGLWITHD